MVCQRKMILSYLQSILQPTAAESYGAVLTESDKQWYEQVCTTFKRTALGLVLIPYSKKEHECDLSLF